MMKKHLCILTLDKAHQHSVCPIFHSISSPMSFRDKLEPDPRLNIYLHLGELIAKRSVLVVRKPSYRSVYFPSECVFKVFRGHI